jgi:nicotinamidase-related amidase
VVDFDVSLDRTALINVDLQNFFVDTTKDGSALVERINELSAVCREAGILVVHTAHVLRPDGSNIGVLGEIISEIREGLLNKGAETASFYPELHIDPRDLVLEKPRFGAFYGTDLESILRSRGIDTVIIVGISTDVCCDTTAREANARDFRVLFLSDGTATNDPDPARWQSTTLEMMEAMFAQVLTIDEVVAKIELGRSKDRSPSSTERTHGSQR